MRKAHSTKALFGFSLIELLVVISIIAAVMAILIPGLGKAKNMARRTVCAGNLKQIDIAMHFYLSINDDTYPAAQDPLSTNPYYWLWMGRGFRKFVMPHLGGSIDANNPSVLWCSQDPNSKERFESTSYTYSMSFYHSPEQIDTMNITSYTYDSSLTQQSIPQRSINVSKPSGKIFIGEWYSNHSRLGGKDPGWWGWAGKRNYLFADGHVYFLDANDIRPANDGNPNPNLTIHGIRGIDWPR